MALARRLVSLGRSRPGPRRAQGPPAAAPGRGRAAPQQPGAARRHRRRRAQRRRGRSSPTTLGEVLSFELVPNFRLLGPRLGAAVKDLPRRAGRARRPAAVGRARAGCAVTVDAADRAGRARTRRHRGPGQGQGGIRRVARRRRRRSPSTSTSTTTCADADCSATSSAGPGAAARARAWPSPTASASPLSGLDELADHAADIGSDVLAVEVTFGSG